MTWLVLSPHFDDAVFSCGGLLAKYAATQEIVVVNAFTGGAPPCRREEEAAAARFLGYRCLSLNLPDAPWRRWIYRLPLAVHLSPFRRHPERSEGSPVLKRLLQKLRERLDEFHPVRLYAPLALGRHIDHLLCRTAAAALAAELPVFFYEDIPYAMDRGPARHDLNRLFRLTQALLRPWLAPDHDRRPALNPHPEDITAFIGQKIAGALLYRSQYRRYFATPERLERALRAFAQDPAQATPSFQERFFI